MNTTDLLRSRVSELEAELAEARRALDYVLKLEANQQAQSQPTAPKIGPTPNLTPMKNSLTLTEAVRVVLDQNPNASTAAVIDNVTSIIPDAKHHSIRSLISQSKKKNLASDDFVEMT